MNEQLVGIALLVAALSGVCASLLRSQSPWTDRFATALLGLGTLFAIVGATRQLAGYSEGPIEYAWSVPWGALVIHVDSLSAMFLLQIFVVGFLGSVYGLGYWPCAVKPRNARKLRTFYGLTIAGMALLVVARNAVLFLMGWELMALSAFLMVSTEDHDPAAREAGMVYLLATRLGTLCLTALFALLYLASGTFSLSLSGLDPNTNLATAIFLLGLGGFGLKAGMMPLHVWLPAAHANAPTHVSALMSGVLIKMGIYGLFRTCSFFAPPPLWWGVTLFGLGVISAILGVAFALGQHDLKRLLAYHSVENIGIILMGLGVAVIGRTVQQPALVALGMAGSMLHVWNHGLFKALLFLSAGSVIHATHTRNIDTLGGLGKHLPRTALAFLVGAVAISGLPPLNGFISEFMVYLGMLRGAVSNLGAVGLLLTLGVPALALVGALAVACFVKVFGAVFLGQARGAEPPAIPQESPVSMLVPMATLGACCVVIGTAPRVVLPALDGAVRDWSVQAAPPLSALVPFSALTYFNSALVLTLAASGILLARLVARSRSTQAGTWDCGYAEPSARMQYTASSFADSLVTLFGGALRPKVHVPEIHGVFPNATHFEAHVPEVVLELLVVPAVRLLTRIAHWSRWIQQGQLHLYILYILATLISMLLLWR